MGRSMLCLAVLGSSLLTMQAQARRAKAAALQPSAQTQRAVEELMGDFKWGMPTSDVEAKVVGAIREEYAGKIRQATEQWQQQKLGEEREKKVKEVRDSFVKFDGQRTGWDVSLIDGEFSHGNDEAMLFRWEQDQRRFFFFYKGELYKMLLVLSQEKFKGKSFAEFSNLIQQRYGAAEPRFSTNKLTGESVFDRLEWPAAGQTMLQAVDQTSFYGNYVLVLVDVREMERVAEGRKIVGPGKSGEKDSLVEDALAEPAAGGGNAFDDDVIDRVTGRSAEGAAAELEESSSSSSNSSASKKSKSAPAPKPKKKPVAGDNPLEGIE